MNRFGNFLEKLLEDLKVSFATASAEMGISEKTLWNWRRRDTVAQGKAFKTLVGYFVIPADVFRAAAEGVSELDPKYRSRDEWLIRRASPGAPATKSPQPAAGAAKSPVSGPSSSGSLEPLKRVQVDPRDPEEVTPLGSEGLLHIRRRQEPAAEKTQKPPKTAPKPPKKNRKKKGD